MRLRKSFGMAVFAVITAMTLGVSSVQAASITWTESLNGALTTAKKTGRPVLIDFTAVWCGPCQEMKRTTFKNAKVITESKKWVMVHMDVDKQEKVAQKYNITAMPTFLVLSPKGKVVARSEGGMDATEFLKWMKSKYPVARK